MSEDTDNQTETTEEDGPVTTAENTPPQAKKSREIRAEVVERLKNVGGPVVAALTETLYKREEDRRIAAALKCIDDIEAKERDLRKLDHGDIVTFDDPEGKVPTKRFSAERIKQRKALQEELGKLNSKLEAALVKNDWSKLLG